MFKCELRDGWKSGKNWEKIWSLTRMALVIAWLVVFSFFLAVFIVEGNIWAGLVVLLYILYHIWLFLCKNSFNIYDWGVK